MAFIEFCYFLLEEVVLAFELFDLHEVAAVLVDIVFGVGEALRGVVVEGIEEG